MTSTASAAGTDTPRRGFVAGAIVLALHAMVLLLAFIAGRVVTPSPGGLEDLAAVAVTFLGGEAVLGLGCAISGMLLFRRGRRNTGAGILGGFVIGLALIVLVQQILALT